MVSVVGVASVSAWEGPKDESSKDETQTAQRLKDLKRAAGMYRIVLDTDRAKELALRDEPILRWTNPLRKTDDGAVFLWTAGGRPEAIASFYRYRNEERLVEEHEFQSLATTGLTAARDGTVIWAPREAGLTLAPIPGAPKPGATPSERLRQMRTLAREFHAYFDLPRDQSELRLLTRPLYRYETSRPDLPDGALFAFVQTTDPEVLLLIEARPAGGALAWHYALARMSMVNLRAQHKERPVWRVDWVDQLTAPGNPYLTIPAPAIVPAPGR
jgi:hypothetical protein